MSAYQPPTENVPIFDSSLFSSSSTTFTQSQADKLYLKYPIGQGNETIPSATINGQLSVGTNMIMNGTANTNYIQFPDGSKQYVASTGISPLNPSPAGTYTIPTINVNSYGQITSASNGTASTSVLSTQTITIWDNKAIATQQPLTTASGTQFVDIYCLGGGGNCGNSAGIQIGAPITALGGAGGSGGAVVYSRLSAGYTGNFLYGLLQPQFVSQVNTTNTTLIWNGTFTQSGTTITITSTTSGAIAIGSIINFTKSAFDASYPSGINNQPYGYFYNQLQVVSGSGTTWVVQTQQSQTLSTAVSANAYTPYVIWEGTFTQSGTTITAVSTTSGTFGSGLGCYLLATGLSANTQYCISTTDPTNVVVNTSQNITTPQAGRIVYCSNGVQAYCWYSGYNEMVSPYTGFPAIAYSAGGTRGTNAAGGQTYPTAGTGGAGGACVAYNPCGVQTNAGSVGQNGKINTDVTGMTRVYSFGGQNPLTWNKIMSISRQGTIQSLNISNEYNVGQTCSTNDQGTSVTGFGQGAIILVCNAY